MRRYVIYHYVHNEMPNGDVTSHRESLCAFTSYQEAERWMENFGTFHHEIVPVEVEEYGSEYRYDNYDFGEGWK